jgi:hypothetical protein
MAIDWASFLRISDELRTGSSRLIHFLLVLYTQESVPLILDSRAECAAKDPKVRRLVAESR